MILCLFLVSKRIKYQAAAQQVYLPISTFPSEIFLVLPKLAYLEFFLYCNKKSASVANDFVRVYGAIVSLLCPNEFPSSWTICWLQTFISAFWNSHCLSFSFTFWNLISEVNATRPVSFILNQFKEITSMDHQNVHFTNPWARPKLRYHQY